MFNKNLKFDKTNFKKVKNVVALICDIMEVENLNLAEADYVLEKLQQEIEQRAISVKFKS